MNQRADTNMRALLDGPISEAINAAYDAAEEACPGFYDMVKAARGVEWPGGSDALARFAVDAFGSHWVVGAGGKVWTWEGDRWSLDAKDYLLEGVARRVVGLLKRRKRDMDDAVERFEGELLKRWPFEAVGRAWRRYYARSARALIGDAADLGREAKRLGIERHPIYAISNLIRVGDVALPRTPSLLACVDSALLREMRRLRFDPQVKEAPAAPPPGIDVPADIKLPR